MQPESSQQPNPEGSQQPHPEGSQQPDTIQIPAPRTVEVLGVPLAVIDYERTLDWIDATVAQRGRGYICACNVHTITSSAEDPELRSALLKASLNVPDGQPLVWALAALGHRLDDRVYGPELMARACAGSAASAPPSAASGPRSVESGPPSAEPGHRHYLYGGRNQGALVQLALNLRRRYPGVQIVGGYSPPHRPLTPGEQAAVVQEINAGHADVVWVGIGVPKQEKWMAQLRDELEAPVLVGVGAAFDFHAGLVPQAPPWMQRRGLEWLFRLVQEPRRLWRRYTRYNPRFVWGFGRQLVGHRRGSR